MNFITSLYSSNTCYIRLQGEDFDGFTMLGGVRQGCPLSPLLFAVCVDLLLRMLSHKLPDLVCKAFADDIAAIVSDWWEQGPILQSIFDEFAHISNLHLNTDKTLCIPLWPAGVNEIKQRIAEHIPAWKEFGVQAAAKILGFFVGPAMGAHNWV